MEEKEKSQRFNQGKPKWSLVHQMRELAIPLQEEFIKLKLI